MRENPDVVVNLRYLFTMKWKHRNWCDKNVTISKESIEKIRLTDIVDYIPRLEFIFWFVTHQINLNTDPIPQKYIYFNLDNYTFMVDFTKATNKIIMFVSILDNNLPKWSMENTITIHLMIWNNEVERKINN